MTAPITTGQAALACLETVQDWDFDASSHSDTLALLTHVQILEKKLIQHFSELARRLPPTQTIAPTSPALKPKPSYWKEPKAPKPAPTLDML